MFKNNFIQYKKSIILSLVLLVVLLFYLGLILYSYKKNDISTINSQTGVVISFDDDYIEEWSDVNKVLQKYNWKATFFLTRFNQLSAYKIRKLKELKISGHEIAAHGLNHINAKTYSNKNGTSKYLNQEIYPMIDLMNANDFKATSFAYPFGSRTPKTDDVLFNEFKILRGTTYGNMTPSLQNCYYKYNRLVFGLGIDNNYPNFSIPYFISLIEYARKNNKIVIFYAHKPVKTSQGKNQTEYKTLIEICKYVKKNNMKFYKISDLYGLKKVV